MEHDVKKDYYSILGVSQSASDEQIRDAFKKLARKHHPDKNPGKKDAEERFKLINEAYNTLGDATKRGAYDYDRRNASSCDQNNNMTSGASSSSAGFSSSYTASNSKPNDQGQSRYSSESRYSSSNAGARFFDTDFSDWRREFARFSRSFDDDQHGEAESRAEDGKKSEQKKFSNARERAKRTKKDAPFGSFFNDKPFKSAFFSQPSFAFSDFDDFVNGEFDEVFERTFARTPFKAPEADSDDNDDDTRTDVQAGAQARAKASRRQQKDALVRCKYCATKMNVVELCQHEPNCSLNPANIREEADRREERRRATGLFGDAETSNPNSTFKEFVDIFLRSTFPHGRTKFQPSRYFDFDLKDSDSSWRREHEATINRIRRDRERTASYDADPDEFSTPRSRYASDLGARPRAADAEAADTSRTRFRKTASEKEARNNTDTKDTPRTSRSRGRYTMYDKPDLSDEPVFVRGMSTGSSRADLGGGCARCRANYGDNASFVCSCGVKTTR